MSATTIRSSIGGAELPDIGTLAYNGVTFSSLYKSRISGRTVPDRANRTVKNVEWSIEVEGTVTLNPGDHTTDATWSNLRERLDTFGGALTYQGKGFGPLNVNIPGGNLFDVAWGPKTEVVDFQPLGASRSAVVRWKVVTQVPELAMTTSTGPAVFSRSRNFLRVLQFNYGASISYDEDAFLTISLSGTLEIPMTRTTINTRTLPDIVDAYRQTWLDIDFDLTRFRISRRRFDISRDKRSIEWEYVAEELPRMGLPPNVTTARGNYSVRPAQQGPSLVKWIATLHATYTVRSDRSPEWAFSAFVALWWYRMEKSRLGVIPELSPKGQGQQAADAVPGFGIEDTIIPTNPALNALLKVSRFLFNFKQAQQAQANAFKPLLIYFSFEEGLYLDSRTVTFEASWTFATTLAGILMASGIWKWKPGSLGGVNQNIWAQSVSDIMGFKGVLEGRLNPDADTIVDLGGGSPTNV